MRTRFPGFLFIFLFIVGYQADAQYYRTSGKTIPGYYCSELYDTLNISGTPGTMDASWGLDSVTLNIAYDFSPDLQISIISPDGTIVHLADNVGYGANFTGSNFNMHNRNFVQFSSAPFTGDQQPEYWMGMINNGHSANGRWMLHIVNQTTSAPDTGILVDWGVHFSSTPAPPDFFDTSALPIIVVTTNDTVVAATGVPVQGRMGIISNTGLNHLSDPFNNYNGNISMHVRGGTSREFPSKSYEVTTEDMSRNDTDAALLGMPADHSWVLYAPWDDKTMIRNILTYRLANDMGEYAVRTRLCQLVMNGDYRGVYVLMEKISRGSGRVNVHKMSATDTTGTAVTGGYIFQADRGYYLDAFQSQYKNCDTVGDQQWYVYAYPKAVNIVDSQKRYIAAYMDSFETQVKTGNLYDTVNGYRKYIDVPSIIDEQLLQELGHNVDAYRLSTYFHKDRNGKVMGGPIWDFNEAFGNASDDDAFRYDTYQWQLACPTYGYIPFWWKTINTDTNYVNELKCRYSNFRLNALDTNHVQGLIDSLAGVLKVPAELHYTRWPILGLHEWANYFVGATYDEEIGYLKGWVRNRITYMDSGLFNPTCIDTTKTPPVPLTVCPAGNNTIKIFPNPATEQLTITSSAPMNKIELYNVVGQQVYEHTEHSRQISISLRAQHMPPGVYTVTIWDDSGSTRKKVVIAGQ